jgi:hypothetical protein
MPRAKAKAATTTRATKAGRTDRPAPGASWLSFALVALAAGGLACGGAEGGGEPPSFLTELRTPQDLEALAAPPDLAEVKYLARVHGQAAPPPLTDACYFQNMRRYTWHLQFLQAFPELAALSYDGYVDLVLRPGTRRLWAGAVRVRPDTPHPSSGTRGVIAYTVYAESGGLDAAGIVAVDRILKGCMPFARDRLVFEPEGPDQIALATLERAHLAEEGVATLLSPIPALASSSRRRPRSSRLQPSLAGPLTTAGLRKSCGESTGSGDNLHP